MYPTILDAVAWEKPASHVVDGESLLPVLEQTGDLKREAYLWDFSEVKP